MANLIGGASMDGERELASIASLRNAAIGSQENIPSFRRWVRQRTIRRTLCVVVLSRRCVWISVNWGFPEAVRDDGALATALAMF